MRDLSKQLIWQSCARLTQNSARSDILVLGIVVVGVYFRPRG